LKKNLPSLGRRGTAKLMRWQSRITQKLFLPFGHVLQPDRWIFIVGCYNSGTSLLAKILAQHPLIAGLPNEGIYFTDRLPYPEQFGWARMWVRCLDKVCIDPEQGKPEMINRIKRQWSLVYTGNRTNLLEKSVVNAVRMPFLQAHFQPAYFINIVRNGYAVAEGIRRRVNPAACGNSEFDDAYPIALCAEQWRACDELIGRDRAGIEKFIQLTYEDLAANPQKVLNKVTEFLGLAAMDKQVFERSWFIGDKLEPVQDMNARSIQRLSESDIFDIERVAAASLAKYGYSRPDVSG